MKCRLLTGQVFHNYLCKIWRLIRGWVCVFSASDTILLLVHLYRQMNQKKVKIGRRLVRVKADRRETQESVVEVRFSGSYDKTCKVWGS